MSSITVQVPLLAKFHTVSRTRYRGWSSSVVLVSMTRCLSGWIPSSFVLHIARKPRDHLCAVQIHALDLCISLRGRVSSACFLQRGGIEVVVAAGERGEYPCSIRPNVDTVCNIYRGTGQTTNNRRNPRNQRVMSHTLHQQLLYIERH